MRDEGRGPSIPRVSALDGARGLAVAGVLLFHAGHLLGGYLGVDFFFTLSGFLITSLLLAESGRNGSVGLGGFWARRARRLLPALAVLMVGVALYCVAFAQKNQLTTIRGDALATLGYFANWHEIFAHQNYFALFSSPSPLNHTWSLAIEEQFYVIWPLIFVALLARWKRSAPKAVFVTALVMAAASTTLTFVLYSPANTNRVYFGTDTRAASILLGAALAAWLAMRGPTTNPARRKVLEGLALVSVVGLAVAWTRLDGQSKTLYHGGLLLCALGGVAVIAAAVHPEPGPVGRALSFRPFVELGLISYGVYLYHWPIDVALDSKQMGFSGWPLIAFQTAVTLGLAVLSYRVVEQPIRHGALSAVQWRKLTPAIAVALVALIVATTAGAPSGSSPNFRHPIAAATTAFQHAPTGAQRVMFVGDSVAYFLGKAMQTVKRDPPIAVFNAGLQGCAFPAGITHVRYHNSQHTVLVKQAFSCDPPWERRAVAAFHPDLVLWLTANPGDAVEYHKRWISTCSPEYATLYDQGIRRVLNEFGFPKTKVVMTTEAYPRYLYADEDGPTDCENRDRHAAAAATGVQLIDLFSYICPLGKCLPTLHGVELRVDGEHFEGAGGRLVGSWLLDHVR